MPTHRGTPPSTAANTGASASPPARRVVLNFKLELSDSGALIDRLGFGKIVKFKPWEEHANLAAWRERVSARPGLAL